MKKLLVLAAGLLQMPVIKKARDMGYYVIAADGDSAAPGLAEADKAVVANITDEEEMLAVARQEGIGGVIHPCSEVSMHVMGRIVDELSLSGIGKQAARAATNKHLMRKAFEAYGAPSPKSFCVEDEEQGWDCFCSIGGEAILKPSRNSGSRGIAEIDTTIDRAAFGRLFQRAKEISRDNSVMVEQFVDGPEFSVEIIVWEAEVHVVQVTDKETTARPYFVELGHSQPSRYPDDMVRLVRDAAVKGVRALGLRNCAVHAEVKVMAGVPYIMEIGARLGGDRISELTHLSTGIDLEAEAIRVAMGEAPILRPSGLRNGVCIRYFCPKPGIIKAINSTGDIIGEGVHELSLYRGIGDCVPEVRSSLDRSGHVIVTASTVEAAIASAEKVVASVEFITE